MAASLLMLWLLLCDACVWQSLWSLSLLKATPGRRSAVALSSKPIAVDTLPSLRSSLAVEMDGPGTVSVISVDATAGAPCAWAAACAGDERWNDYLC